jgi:tetratricopeptide (TPR) repeat protein
MARASNHPAPNLLRDHRLRLGLEQWQVAEALAALATQHGYGEIPLDAHAVSRHERGVHRPTRRYRALYALFCGVAESELWPQPGRPVTIDDPVLSAPWDHRGTVEASLALTGSGGLVERRAFLFLAGVAATAPAHQWLVQEPGRLAAALGGDRVTPELADRLPAMIAELRRMDDTHSPAVVHPLAAAELGWVTGLLDNGSYTEPTARKLHLALAEFAQIAGYTANDRGDHARAQRAYVSALRAAHTADDRALGAFVLKCLASQALLRGRPDDTLTFAESALAGLGRAATAGESALLHSWRGRALAVLGEEAACRSAISSAQGFAEQMRVEDNPPWLYWLSPVEIQLKTGESLLAAGRPAQAEPLLDTGLSILPADRQLGDRQVLLTRLAMAQCRNGRLDAATASGNRALDLAARRSSHRGLSRIKDLCRELRPQAAVPEVQDFLDRARELPAA